MTRYAQAKVVAATLVEAGALSGDDAVRTVWKWVRGQLCVAKRLPGERGRVLVGVDADGFPVRLPRPAARRASRRR